jgi:tetratricopeptide (TPR) repeat protein
MIEAVINEQGPPTLSERLLNPGEAEMRGVEQEIAPEAVREQLHRILASRAFARSPRISRFLGFVVEQTLAGQDDKLKEYLLGVEVFNRMESFDPRIDSIVRVEARRLRYKLEKYYEMEGQRDEVFIRFRKGCYIPAFTNKRRSEELAANRFDFPALEIIANTHAFGLYALGRHNLSRWSADGIAESVSFFTHALTEDPACAGAHAGLATAWTLSALLGLMPARDVMAKAKSSAAEALLLRPTCGEAHAIQGIATALFDFEWNEAGPLLTKAITSNPCEGSLRLWYGLWAMLSGKPAEARRELQKAQHAAPTSITAHLAMGFACHLERDTEEALTHYRLAHDLDPSFYAPHLAMGLLLTEQQMFEQAQNALTHASQLSPRNPNVMAVLAYSHAAAGRPDAAHNVLAELNDLSGRQYVAPFARCLAYSGTGQVEQAVQELEKAYDERSSWLGLVRALPVFGPVRNDSRFPALAARIGLA